MSANKKKSITSSKQSPAIKITNHKEKFKREELEAVQEY